MESRSRDSPVEIECEEYGHVDVDPALLLTPDGQRLDIYDSVRDKDVYRVSFSKGKLRFTASSYVGVIPLNPRVVLLVKPRVPVASLTHMVTETGQPTWALQAFRDYRTHGDAQDWMLDCYAEAMVTNVEQILSHGLYRRYVRRQSSGSFPRGRIDFNRTFATYAARRIPNKVVYEWYERTVDIPANQCIKAALLAVHSHVTRDSRASRKSRGYGTMLANLGHQLNAFSEVSDVQWRALKDDGEVIGTRPLPEPRFYYRPALDLASLILGGSGIALEVGGADGRVASLLIEMNDLFENYARRVLQQQAEERGWRVAVLDQEGRVPLYETPDELPDPLGAPIVPIGPSTNAEATPDIVFRMPDDQVVLIGEVKNTAKGGDLPDRTEVNQAVTYATRYGLDRALLIRPAKEGNGGLTYAGQVGEVAVYDFKIDLGNEDFESVNNHFADSVEGLLPTNATN